MWNARDTNRASVARLHDSRGHQSTHYEPRRTSFTKVGESAQFQATQQTGSNRVVDEESGQDLDDEEQRIRHDPALVNADEDVGVSSTMHTVDLDNDSSGHITMVHDT